MALGVALLLTTFWALLSFRRARRLAREQRRLEEALAVARAEADSGRATEASLRESLAQLRTLRLLDLELLKSGSAPEVARAAANALRRLIGCERAGVLFFNASGEEATLVSSQDGVERPREEALPLSPLTRVTGLDHGSATITDLTEILREASIAHRLWQGGLRYGVRLPLVAEGEWLGSLNLASRSRETFDDATLRTARAVSDRLAVALRRFDALRATAEREVAAAVDVSVAWGANAAGAGRQVRGAEGS